VNVNSFGHFVKRNKAREPRCIVGGRTQCYSWADFVVGYSYRKKQPSKAGTHLLEVQVKRAACELHARKFASAHKLEFPGGAR